MKNIEKDRTKVGTKVASLLNARALVHTIMDFVSELFAAIMNNVPFPQHSSLDFAPLPHYALINYSCSYFC